MAAVNLVILVSEAPPGHLPGHFMYSCYFLEYFVRRNLLYADTEIYVQRKKNVLMTVERKKVIIV